jgi:hypothetical protein
MNELSPLGNHMKRFLTAFLISASGLEAQPIIHLGADIAFDGDYRVGEAITQADGTRGNIVFWSTSIRVNPVESNGYFNWFVFDEWAPLLISGSVDDPTANVATWYPPETFYNPLPPGYEDPTAEWVTNYFAFAYVPGQRENYNLVFSTGITPHQDGDVWLDWARNGRLRVAWSKKPPKNFGSFRHDGTQVN